MRNTRTTPRRRRSGNAVLETALVLQLLLWLAFGTVEFGYFFHIQHCLQGAAQDAARIAITPDSTYAQITTSVSDAMTAYKITGYTTSVRKGADINAPTLNAGNFSSLVAGDPICVSVTIPAGSLPIRPLGLITASKQVTGMAVMRKED
jgi:Flp pilus assembly protein TadG